LLCISVANGKEVLAAKWNLKETGGNRLILRTETAYKPGDKGYVAKETKVQKLHGLLLEK
jgi:hypothetical protein